MRARLHQASRRTWELPPSWPRRSVRRRWPRQPIASRRAAPAGLVGHVPGGSLVIPAGLASGISSETVAAVAGRARRHRGGNWRPSTCASRLQGYALQGKFHEPQIIVFPAAEYAAVNESAAANIQLLQGVLSNPGSVPESTNLPHITFFNAGPVFQSQVAVMPFQGGLRHSRTDGVRTVRCPGQQQRHVLPFPGADLRRQEVHRGNPAGDRAPAAGRQRPIVGAARGRRPVPGLCERRSGRLWKLLPAPSRIC